MELHGKAKPYWTRFYGREVVLSVIASEDAVMPIRQIRRSAITIQEWFELSYTFSFDVDTPKQGIQGIFVSVVELEGDGDEGQD